MVAPSSVKHPLAGAWFWRHQQGAVFGMDARLVMILFGTIVVVASVILFNKIDSAETAALAKRIQVVDDELKNMQFDLGIFPPFALENRAAPTMALLWDESVLRPQYRKLWNGPYIYPEQMGSYNWEMRYASTTPDTTCTTTNTCYVWLGVRPVAPDKLPALKEIYGVAQDADEGNALFKFQRNAKDFTIWVRSIER